MQKILTVLALSGILAFGMPNDAQAQTTNIGDNLVNVQIGDITIQDINVAVAAQIVANVCANVNVGVVAVIIGEIDDATQGPELFCRIGRAGRGPEVTVTQN